jgi:hypothetical protein
VLDRERRLLAEEHEERVDQLAASVAHLLNNPLGALTASIAYARECVGELAPGETVGTEDLGDLREALRDAENDARRIHDLVSRAFASARSEQRAVMRAKVVPAVREGLDHFVGVGAGHGTPLVHIEPGLRAGVPRAGLARWVFRLLTTLAPLSGQPVEITGERDVAGPLLRVVFDGLGGGTVPEALESLAAELTASGARLHLVELGGRTTASLHLPPDVADAGAALESVA